MNRKISKSVSIFLAAGIIAMLFVGVAAAADKNYGDPIGEYKGVIANSSGACVAIYTGNCANLPVYNKYQCVEYVKRFYKDAMLVDVSKWTGADAYQYYDVAPERNLDRYLNGESIPPQPDDILVFTNGYGHVAIITAVGETTVTVIEQNVERNQAIHTIPYNKTANRIGDTNGDRWPSTTYTLRVQGWLRSKPTFLSLTHPNGLEIWYNGSTSDNPSGTYNIAWNHSGRVGTTVKLELLNSATSGVVHTIIDSTSIGADGEGTYSWAIPSSITAGNYLVKVTSNYNTSINDTSYAHFSIYGVPTSGNCGTIVDYDGNFYTTEIFGLQCWVKTSFLGMHSPSGHDLAHVNAFYNWYSAQWACPSGTHLPNATEFVTLGNFIGNSQAAFQNSNWHDGFNGYSLDGVSIRGVGTYADYWTADENVNNGYRMAYGGGTYHNSDSMYGKKVYFSARCIIDETAPVPTSIPTPVTDYDGNSYNVRYAGNNYWTDPIRSTHNASGGAITRYCYNGISGNCDSYNGLTPGGLYTWSQAMDGSITEGAQGICPTGFYLPTAADVHDLVDAVAGTHTGSGAQAYFQSNPWDAGYLGFRSTNGIYAYFGTYVDYWTSTKSTYSGNPIRFAYGGGQFHPAENFGSGNDDAMSPAYGFSVRCVKSG